MEGAANCYFRGHRLFEEGKKIKPSEVKTHGRLKEVDTQHYL